MISRYSLHDTANLSHYFQLPHGLPRGIKPRYNISPTTVAPIILQRDGERHITSAKWGLIAEGAKDTNSVFRYKTYNVPSEKIFAKHSWERAVRSHRCLIPANGFYTLPKDDDQDVQYTRAASSQLIAFAGIYSTWKDTEGVTHDTFSMITIESPKTGERVPIIITPEGEQRWLDSDITDTSSLYDLLRIYPEEPYVTYAVSQDARSPKIHGPHLIQPK